jgi:hypothetical protein
MGKRIKLSNGRRLVEDIIHVANKTPLAGFSADQDAGLVAKFRRHSRPKISWNVLYMKAYAIVCKRDATLRRSYVNFPWSYLYEHDQNVCMMTIAREHEGEERLFFARFNSPEERTLVELQDQFDHYRRAPISDIKQFRHQINFAKAPRFARRFAWWALANLWPKKRASHMGTFGLSISGNKGCYGVSTHLGPTTTTLGVDPSPKQGVSKVVVTFDHRVLDGAPVTRAMQKMHQILITSVMVELAELTGFHPDTGEKMNDIELAEFKRNQRLRRIEMNRKRRAA